MSITLSDSRDRAGQGWCLQWRCQDLSGASFKSLHSSPVFPFWLPDPSYFTLSTPLFLRPSSSSLCEGGLAVWRVWWHLSWQQLSVSAINYTGWLTPSLTLIPASLFTVQASDVDPSLQSLLQHLHEDSSALLSKHTAFPRVIFSTCAAHLSAI